MFGYIDRTILSCLGENSRMPLLEIAKRARCSPQTVKNRLVRLEARGLQHTADIAFEKLGFTTEFFIRVKFNEGVPPPEPLLSQTLNLCPYVQFAALCSGDFDMFIWSIARSNAEYEREMETPIRVQLDEYIADWCAHSLLLRRVGFLPVGNEIISASDLSEREKTLLRLLNTNSRTSLTEMARTLGVSTPTAKYHFKKLSKYVNLCTSYLTAYRDLVINLRFFYVMGSEAIFKKDGRAVTRLYLADEGADFDKTVYATVPTGGLDNFFIEAFPSVEAYNAHNQELFSHHGIVFKKHSAALITRVLKGTIPIRKTTRQRASFLLSPVEVGPLESFLQLMGRQGKKSAPPREARGEAKAHPTQNLPIASQNCSFLTI